MYLYSNLMAGLTNDGKSQAKGVMALVIVDQGFGVTGEVLGLQVKVQAFAQQPGHGIGQV
jgi:hypothetical protein